MIWIAEPKSSSCSLSMTLHKILNIKCIQSIQRKKNEKNCEGFENLQKYHTSLVKRKFTFLKKYIEDENILYKEHLLPIRDHINFIEQIGKPIFVLIRKSDEIVDSYKRIFSVLPQIEEIINYEKLKGELDLFSEMYLKKEKENPKIWMVITFRDLMFNCHEIIKKITDHYGYNLDIEYIKRFKYEKRNYTGHGIRKIKGEKQYERIKSFT